MLYVAANEGKKLFSVVGICCIGLNSSKRTLAYEKTVIHESQKYTIQMNSYIKIWRVQEQEIRLKRTLTHRQHHRHLGDRAGEYESSSLPCTGPVRLQLGLWAVFLVVRKEI